MAAIVAVVAVVALAVVALADRQDASSAGTASGDPLYGLPAHPAAAARGTLITSEQVQDSDLDADVWRIAYHSRSVVDDRDIPVTGWIAVPRGPVPPGGRPVASYGHPTRGVADRCAPSHDPGSSAGVIIDRLLAAGIVVVGSDFEGLGTPGRHLYLVGESEARGMLDAARAARRFAPAHAGRKVLLWGYSQGGQGALFAGQDAASDPAYDDLDVVGVAGLAPVADVPGFVAASGLAHGDAITPMVVASYATAYPELRPTSVLEPEAVRRLGVVDRACTAGIGERYADLYNATLASPLQLTDGWRQRLEQNVPGRTRIAAPVIVFQGTEDFVVAPDGTDALVQRLCANGTTVDQVDQPGADHGSVIGSSAPALARWARDRFDGRPVTPGCRSTVGRGA